jgi:hypothetical protein
VKFIANSTCCLHLHYRCCCLYNLSLLQLLPVAAAAHTLVLYRQRTSVDVLLLVSDVASVEGNNTAIESNSTSTSGPAGGPGFMYLLQRWFPLMLSVSGELVAHDEGSEHVGVAAILHCSRYFEDQYIVEWMQH